MAEPWIGESAVIEWRNAMSSTQLRQVREQVADPLAALAVLLELPLRPDDAALVLVPAAAEGLDGDRLAVERVELRACSRTCRRGSARRT